MANSTHEVLFAEAMNQHMGIFMKTAYAFAEPADRDDLVQEILLTVWQALPTFDQNRCKLSTFLYRVANNRAMSWNRSQRRYGRKLQVFQQSPQLCQPETGGDVENTRLEWLYGLLRQLPPLDRTLLMLHFDQLSHREIGEVTGLTENNVGVRLHRIKRWIAEQKGDSHGS
jgi:RNA polymerase sigma-70 factor (ECF subfamily)